MKIVAVGIMEGEAYNLPIPTDAPAVTLAIYGGEIGNLRLYGYVTVEQAFGKQQAGLSITKPADVEWGNIQDGNEWCWPPVKVQSEPTMKETKGK